MIKLMPGIASPALVTAADMLTLEMAPQYNEYVNYGMTAIGYLAGFMGWGRGDTGEFLFNLGPCSLPLTARAIRAKVKGMPITRRTPVAGQRLALRPTASRGPVRQSMPPDYAYLELH